MDQEIRAINPLQALRRLCLVELGLVDFFQYGC